MPAPAFCLLFLTGDAYLGLTVMLALGRFFGYVGMFLLAGEVTGNSRACAVAAVLYGWQPFLSVYGLSQFGIPLLIWSVLQIKNRRHIVCAYLYVALYALTSSLVLVGFGLLGMGVLWLFWCRRRHREGFLRTLGAFLLLLGIYVAENCRLLAELFGGAVTSHKAEYALAANPFWGLFGRYLAWGGQHSEDYHLLPVLFGLAVFLAAAFVRKKSGGAGTDRLRRAMGICMGWNILLVSAAALWDSAAGVWLRGRMEAFGAFQLNRLLWIAPCFWYLLFACGLALAGELLKGRAARVAGKPDQGRKGRLPVRLVLWGLTAAVFAFTGARILLAGDVKSNVGKLRNPDYGMMSFREYYATDVMDQIEAYLRETTGQEMQDYRVVSLGIDPVAALYHGFYCLDGYSNNYSLEYKHAFREIIAPELAKSEYLTEYFDEWGNRCYLFSAECPGYYTIEKGGFFFQDYQLNREALAELGGSYLFSAAYILNAEEQGLSLLREEPFETMDSYYRIFVSAVGKG